MLRIHIHRSTSSLAALGQWKTPYQADIEQITRAMPKCFKSKQIVPAIRRSMDFARNVSVSGIPADQRDTAKKLLDAAWYQLDYWERRLTVEDPEKTYCAGKTDDKPSQDRWLITQSLTKPFEEASRVAGNQEVANAARRGLVDDLTDPTRWGVNLRAFLADLPTWVWGIGALVGGIALLGVYQRIRGPRAVITTSPQVTP